MALQLNTMVIIAAFFAILFLLIAFRSMRIRLLESGFLFIAVISAFFFALFFGLSYVERAINQDTVQALIFEKTSFIPLCTIWISGYYYYEGMIHDHPILSHQLFFLIMYAGSLVFMIMNIADAYVDGYMMNEIAKVIVFWYGTIFHTFAIIVTRKILQTYNRRNIKIDMISLITVGSGTFFVGSYFLLPLFGVSSNNALIPGVIGAVLIITGIAVLGLNQYKSGDYIFNTPVLIHVVLIYNKGGQLVYSRNVHPESVISLFGNKDALISGALSAFGSFFKEILGTHNRLTHLDATGYEFFFSPLAHEEGTVVLVASGSNYFLHKGLKKFVQGIPSSMSQEMNTTGEVSHFEDPLDANLIKSFPFLVIDKTKQADF
jgi:hypothetical protein